MGVGDNIRRIRESKGWSQGELAEKMGYSDRSTISRIENGDNDLTQSKIVKLAKILGVSPADIMGWSTPAKLQPIRIPVLGRIPAGVPVEAIEDILDWEELDPRDFNPTYDYFGLRVTGDSMYPKYMEGDTVICQAAEDVESGRDVVAYVNGYDATLKTLFKRDDGSIELRPINPYHPPRIYKTEPVCILGFVRELRRTI